MTAQELAQHILEIAHKAMEQERLHNVVYIGDICHAQLGLEDIVKLCEDVPKDQDAFKQYEKKEVSHVKTSKN